MARHWTKEQALAICDTNGTILLSAAAGSGKTAVLVERVLRMLTRKKNPVPADKLLIVTFTNEAAKEMKRRLDSGLSSMIQQHPEKEEYRRQQILLQKADISTISSFCAKMTREHFQELNLPADFRIADEGGELTELRNAVMEDVLEEQYQNGGESFTDFVEFVSGKDDRRVAELVLKLYDFIRSLPFEFRWLDEHLTAYCAQVPLTETKWGKIIRDYCRDVLTYQYQLMEETLSLASEDEYAQKSFGASCTVALQEIKNMLLVLENGDWDTLYYLVRDFKLGRSVAYKGNDIILKERIAGMRTRVKKKINDLAGQMAGSEQDFAEDCKVLYPMVRVLFDTVKLFYRRYAAEKLERGIADFSDLEHYTLQLLVEETTDGYQKTKLAEQLSQEYQYLLIDEYQDTNEAQDLIFEALSKTSGNMFMVGDVKQSIYRFRQAMPEIFLDKRAKFSSYDRKHYPATLILGKNFRSRTYVTDIVNYLFFQLMSKETGEIDYNKDEELVSGAVYQKNDATAEFHVIDLEGEKYPEKKSVYEARYVATRIQTMLKEGYLVQDGESLRPCRPNDFCILLRSQKGKTQLYAAELNRLGIMSWADTSGEFLASREVSVLLSLLQTIDNPLADIPLLATMLSPLFSFQPDDLAGIRLESPGTSLYVAVMTSAKKGNKLAANFLEKLSEYRQFAAVLQVNRLVEYLLDDTGFMDILLVTPEASQKRSNIRLFCDYAMRYSKAGYLGLSGFLRFIARMQEKGEDIKSASRAPDGENAVRIMSIHSSKGLEFPICIVADCGKEFNKKDLYTDGLNADLGFSMKIRNIDKLQSYSNAPFEAVKLENERLMLSEEMRVLYVALTRAKEKLIMTMTSEDLKKEINSLLPAIRQEQKLPYYPVRCAKSFGQWLLLGLLRHPDAEAFWQLAETKQKFILPCTSGINLTIAQPLGQEVSEEEQERSFTQPFDGMLFQKIKEQAERQYEYEEETRLPSKLAVTELVAAKSENAGITLSTPKFLQEEKLSGAEKGTAVHTFLQFADFERAKQNLPDELRRMVKQKFLTPMQGEAIDLVKLESFFCSDICHEILTASSVYREYKFMYEIPAKELYDNIAGEAKILVQGIADCVIEKPDGIVIVDYKTDHVFSADVLVRRYKSQLELYRRAISAQFEKPVIRCVIYSVELMKEVEI